jgi:hypothetical protein
MYTYKAMKLVHSPHQRGTAALGRPHDCLVAGAVQQIPFRFWNVEFAVIPELDPSLVYFWGRLPSEL